MRAPDERVIADASSYRSGPGWHVAQTDDAEYDVHLRVHQAGFKAWVPGERVKPSKAKPHLDRIRPFLPGYLFVLFDPLLDDWRSLTDIRGVDAVLTNNDMPLRVPTAWVDALRYAEMVGELDRTKIDPDGFKVGEQVRIADGPFAGHHAVIQQFLAKMRSTTAKKRAKVLMSFLGQMTTMELPVTGLEKV